VCYNNLEGSGIFDEMITNFLLNIVNAFVNAVFFIFPVGQLPFNLTSAVQTAYSYGMAFDRYLPMTEFFQVTLIMGSFWLLIFSSKMLMFILNWFRGR